MSLRTEIQAAIYRQLTLIDFDKMIDKVLDDQMQGGIHVQSKSVISIVPTCQTKKDYKHEYDKKAIRENFKKC